MSNNAGVGIGPNYLRTMSILRLKLKHRDVAHQSWMQTALTHSAMAVTASSRYWYRQITMSPFPPKRHGARNPAGLRLTDDGPRTAALPGNGRGFLRLGPWAHSALDKIDRIPIISCVRFDGD